MHLLQIWILPEKKDLTPSYEQTAFSDEEKRGRLRLVASHDGRDGSVTIHQDAAIHASLLGPGERADFALAPGRHAWVQVIRGGIGLNGIPLAAGDGAAVSAESLLTFQAAQESEFLLFDLA